jgi:hypothetical protein
MKMKKMQADQKMSDSADTVRDWDSREQSEYSASVWAEVDITASS